MGESDTVLEQSTEPPFPLQSVHSDFDPLHAPPDQVVYAYTQSGLHQAWVEGFAKHSEPFRSELITVLEELKFAHEPISLNAFRWLRTHRQQTAQHHTVHLPPSQLAAASLQDHPNHQDHMVEQDLGQLGPINAMGYLRIFPHTVELRIVAPESVVSSVNFQGIQINRPDEHGTWSITTTRQSTDQTLTIAIRATDGRVFEDTLALVQ